MNQILAKSDGTTLFKHTEDTLKVFKSVKKRYYNVPKLCGVENFWEILFVSLFLHDIGKIATGFQKSLFRDEFWGYRHEILSASCVSQLKNFNESEKSAIALSIMGHHKSINYIRERYATYPSHTGKKHYESKIDELLDNINFLNNYLSKLSYLSTKYLGKTLINPSRIKSNRDLCDSYKTFILPKFISPWQDEEYNNLHDLFGYYLKGFITACDHLASGSKFTILDGVKDIKDFYTFESYRTIQIEAMKTKSDAILIAPTGTGKTEAALFWSDNNQNKYCSKRVFYLLPYTASINAMYERLINDFGRNDLVGLLHGKAGYYLYKSLAEENDYCRASLKAKKIKNLTRKIYRPYKIMTPYQVLKSFFGVKGFEQHLSEMTNGLFILDEIHAYNPHTTALIIQMLKILKNDFNAKIFVMSATIPKFLKDIIKKELKIKKEIKLDKDKLKKFTRHKLNIISGEITDNYDLILNDLNNDKKVLVVCNTVQRAQEVFIHLKDMCDNGALLHSRYILKDREKIEKKLKNLDLLVGTQAIEVSLDISYDVLYTEPSPIDALIQRFGRVNRKGWDKEVKAQVYIFKKGSDNDKYIYNQKLVEETINAILDRGNPLILSEDMIQNLEDEIYKKGFSKEDWEEYNMVKKNFKTFFNNTIPFIEDSVSEKNFYSLYESYEVIPIKFRKIFEDMLNDKRYFEAMGYLTSISAGQFNKLKKENRVNVENNNIFIDAKYDKNIGLLLKEMSENII